MCEGESEFSAKTICINSENESKFRLVAILLICVFARKTNRRVTFRIEQTKKIN